MTEVIFKEYLITEIQIKEQKSIRLERIANDIVYGEYQRDMKKNNDIIPENYTNALDFLDLQITFTEENFNITIQKALKILYDAKDNNG